MNNCKSCGKPVCQIEQVQPYASQNKFCGDCTRKARCKIEGHFADPDTLKNNIQPPTEYESSKYSAEQRREYYANNRERITAARVEHYWKDKEAKERELEKVRNL